MKLTKEQFRAEIEETLKDVMGATLKDLEAQHTKNMEALQAKQDALESDKGDRQRKKGEVASRMFMAIANSKGNPMLAVEYAKKNWKDDEEVIKALSASIGSSGGNLVQGDYAAEIIEFLRPASAIRKMNPTIMPMPNGSLNLRKLTGGSTGYYIGESTQPTASQPTTGFINLTFKKLAALVPISNDLLRSPSAQAEMVVRDDAVAALAQREDQGFIRDDGTSSTPRGLRYLPQAANITASNGTTLANVRQDLRELLYDLKSNNARMLRPGWLMSNRSELYLRWSLTDGNSNLVFEREMSQGRLAGLPYAVTNNIPDNLGGGGNESELYLVDFADVIIGEADQLILDVSDQASYVDSGSNQVNAFAVDETVLRVISRHDIGLRHDFSVAVKTGVTYGA